MTWFHPLDLQRGLDSGGFSAVVLASGCLAISSAVSPHTESLSPSYSFVHPVVILGGAMFGFSLARLEFLNPAKYLGSFAPGESP